MYSKSTTLHATLLAASAATFLVSVAYDRGMVHVPHMPDVPVEHAAAQPQPKLRRYPLVLTGFERKAERLKKRLAARFRTHTTQLDLVRALAQKKHLEQEGLAVQFMPDVRGNLEEKQLQTWNVTMSRYPHWMTFDLSEGEPRFTVNAEAIVTSLSQALPEEVYAPVHGVVTAMKPDEDGILRVETTTVAHGGYIFDPVIVADRITAALKNGDMTVQVPVQYQTPKLFVVQENGAVKELSLLASGASNFAGSPLGRAKNIEKALHEKITNIVVPANEEFSFNDALNGEVSTSNGWFMSLAIFNGEDLRPVPGGGICQAATTLYRAAVLAGLPIVEQKNHSLYVTYYKKYGVGIDATVYPGQQDFVFLNDTGNDIVIQSSTHDADATVNIYGVPDGRKVALTGPYFAATAPESIKIDGERAPARNEVVWVRTVTMPDGEAIEETLVSRYKAIPKSLPKEYTHAAAYRLE